MKITDEQLKSATANWLATSAIAQQAGVTASDSPDTAFRKILADGRKYLSSNSEALAALTITYTNGIVKLYEWGLITAKTRDMRLSELNAELRRETLADFDPEEN